jgi:hypothetical protein
VFVYEYVGAEGFAQSPLLVKIRTNEPGQLLTLHLVRSEDDGAVFFGDVVVDHASHAMFRVAVNVYGRVYSGLMGQGAQIRGAVTRHFGIRRGLDLRS